MLDLPGRTMLTFPLPELQAALARIGGAWEASNRAWDAWQADGDLPSRQGAVDALAELQAACLGW